MSQNSYINANQYIHPEKADAENEDSGFYQIYNFKESALYIPGSHLANDERMVSYRGRHKAVVYEMTKLVKWGFRPFILGDSDNGYTYCWLTTG